MPTLVFGTGKSCWDVFLGAYLLQHLEDRLIGASMRRAPQGSNARRNACKRVGLARACIQAFLAWQLDMRAARTCTQSATSNDWRWQMPVCA